MDKTVVSLDSRLLELVKATGYNITQVNGQRIYGPPPDWEGGPPPRGSEVFVGKLPRDCFEDELVPVFSQVGKIYELRMMMDFSGSNRGFCFVTYTSPMDAYQAIRTLNNYQIRPSKRIGVVKSVDNCRLFIGGIPKTKTAEDIREELSGCVEGIVDVIVYRHFLDRSLNRGFAFIEFDSHKSAAMARRKFIPGRVKLWDQEVLIEWAEPEPDIDEEVMKRVKVLYIRNLPLETPQYRLHEIIQQEIEAPVVRCKKIKDFAFVHFETREEAERAYHILRNLVIDGVEAEVKWAKPVNTELYRLQKPMKGHGKFNNSMDLSHTLKLYKQYIEESSNLSDVEMRKRCDTETTNQSSSGYVGSSTSPSDMTAPYISYPSPVESVNSPEEVYRAPMKLDAICNKYSWSPPIYYYAELPGGWWTACAVVPNVGAPPASVASARSLAHAHAANNMLTYIRSLRGFSGVLTPTQMQPQFCTQYY